MYGKCIVTPNMHLHGHLKETLLDFGPVQEFWLFSFERYNGILGKQPTNNRVIEPQLMQRFLRDNVAISFPFPKEFKEEFSCLLISDHDKVVGSLHDTLTPTEFALPSKSTRGVFDLNSLDVLKSLYIKIFPHANISDVNSELSVHKVLIIDSQWEDLLLIWYKKASSIHSGSIMEREFVWRCSNTTA